MKEGTLAVRDRASFVEMTREDSEWWSVGSVDYYYGFPVVPDPDMGGGDGRCRM